MSGLCVNVAKSMKKNLVNGELSGERLLRKKNMSRQIDKKSSMQVRIDASLHRLLKIKAAKTGRSIKELVEEGLAEVLAVKYDSKRS